MRLVLEQLTKEFKNRAVVKKVNLELREGVYGFLGANGAGKTTLMQMICGILSPTSGEVKLDGKNNLEMGEEFRDLLGYLPQELGYTPGFTAEDFLHYISSVKGLKPAYAKRRSEELLQMVGLYQDRKRKIRTFSGGMKRRLGIAQALLNDPKILILDEPTAGLDPKERIYFRNLIAEMGRDKIILISTHIVSDVEYISDEILIMKKGRLLLQGTAKELSGSMKGKVWSCRIPVGEWRKFEQGHTIINSHRDAEAVQVRVLSKACPYPKAEAAVPTLEDLYLNCFSETEEYEGIRRRDEVC